MIFEGQKATQYEIGSSLIQPSMNLTQPFARCKKRGKKIQ